jgi:hypothetical protein
VKILSLTLTPTHLKGLVFDKERINLSFECPLTEYSPVFFDRLNIDLSTLLITFVLPEATTLYKEKTFHNVPKTSLKNLVKFYEKSLFPFEEDEAYFVSEVLRKKKNLSLKTTTCMSSATSKTLEDLKCLGLYPDALSSWQTALHASLNFFLKNKEPVLVFYIKNHTLFVFHGDQEHILFSTLLKIDTHSLKNLESALSSLKLTLNQENLESFIIGDNASIEAYILQAFPNGKHQILLDKHQDNLLLFGAGLLAQTNTFNLLKKEWTTPSKVNIPLFKHLTTLNIALCGIVLFFTLSLSLYHNFSMRNAFKQIDPSSVPVFVSQSVINKKITLLESLKYLDNYIPQVPTPAEVVAFLSAHPILNQIDKASGKNTSIHYLDYSPLSVQYDLC